MHTTNHPDPHLAYLATDPTLKMEPRHQAILFAIGRREPTPTSAEFIRRFGALIVDYDYTHCDGRLGEDERDRTLQGIRSEWNEALDELVAAFPDIETDAAATK